MEALHHEHAVPCRCGGQAKVFGPSGYAPGSQWGVYCSKDDCEKMATGDCMEKTIEIWNEEQMIAIY
ncbi:MAG: hypothetical protein IBX47_12725 [Desulfuromonadales bacterium]|nr:hypothetical protein [Desulfuromonadales bacterium]